MDLVGFRTAAYWTFGPHRLYFWGIVAAMRMAHDSLMTAAG